MTVAELIVKLSAVGGDEVKRKLNETEKDLKKTGKAAKEPKTAFEQLEYAGINVANALKNVGKWYSAITPQVATFIGAAGAGTVVVAGFTTAMVGLSAASYKMMFDSRAAGEEFEAMKARLEGLTGSATRAQELMALAAKEAGPSEFTTQQLEQSTVSLAAFGQNVERVLPMITKLGQAMGADQERLMMYTRAMNMLKQGQMPDAEVMGAMGISKKDMAAKGVKFDAGGSLLSSAEEAMVALEKIIDEKYSGALKRSADTTKALKATTLDSLQMIERKFGEVTNNALKPFYKAIGGIAGEIASSQFPQIFAEQMMKPLEAIVGVGLDVKSVFLDIVAVLASMANILPRNLSYIIKEWQNVSKDQTFLGSLQRIGSRSMTLLTALPRMFDPTGKTTGDTGNVMSDFYGFRYALESKLNQAKEDDKKKKDPFGAGGDTKQTKESKDVKTTLEKIESNTKKSADLLDLRRQTLGGGEMGRLGITGAELAGMGMNYRSEITKVKPIRGDTMVTRGIKDMIQNNILFAVNGGQGMPVR
jgi:hypothetical protein